MSNTTEPFTPLFVMRDGPSDAPNGFVLVKIVGYSTNRSFFIVEVVRILKGTGPLSLVGSKLETHRNALGLHWEGHG